MKNINNNILNTQKYETNLNYNDNFPNSETRNNLNYTDINNYKIIYYERDKMSDCDYLSKNEDIVINHIFEFPSQFLPFDKNEFKNNNNHNNYNKLKEKEINLNDFINNIDIKIDDNKIINNNIDDLNINSLNNDKKNNKNNKILNITTKIKADISNKPSKKYSIDYKINKDNIIQSNDEEDKKNKTNNKKLITKEKIKSLPLLSKNNIKEYFNYFKNKYVFQNYINNKQIEFNINDIKSQNELIIYSDDRFIIKFSSIYLIKEETAVFLFNEKKFKECYEKLINEKIFNENFSLDEFALALILIPNFDKSLITDFLLQDKYPNDNFIITDKFFGKFDYKEKNILDCLRFVLEFFYLPKEKEKINILMKNFATNYLNQNNNNENLNNEQSILNYIDIILDINENKNPDVNFYYKKYSNFNKDLIYDFHKELLNHPIKLIDISSQNISNQSKSQKIISINNSNNKSTNSKISETKENTNVNESNMDINKLILKNGIEFEEIVKNNQKNSVIFFLSKDETCLNIKTTSCCNTSNYKIFINDINNIIVGETNLTNKKNSENFFTICDNKNNLYKFYNKNKNKIEQFIIILNNILSNNEKKNEQNLVNIWKEEIIEYWKNYRYYLLNKEYIKKFFLEIYNKTTNINNLFDKNFISNNKNYVIKLFCLGIPKNLRNYIWEIIIKDNYNISESLFQYYIKIAEKEYENASNNKSNNIESNSIILYNKIKEIYEIYKEQIEKKKIQKNYNSEMFKIIFSFYLHRPDIDFDENIIFITNIFYLNSNGYFKCFKMLTNFLLNTSIFDLINNNTTNKEKDLFFLFDDEFKNSLNKLYEHFQRLQINSNIFFYKWVKNLFCENLKYEIVLRIFDNFLMKENVIFIEVSLALLKYLEKDLNTNKRSEIFEILKNETKKISEKELFNIIDEINIEKHCFEQFNKNENENEKKFLLKD